MMENRKTELSYFHSKEFQDFIHACKNHEWENLKENYWWNDGISSTFKSSFLILMSALYETYHPEKDEKEDHGFSWLDWQLERCVEAA